MRPTLSSCRIVLIVVNEILTSCAPPLQKWTDLFTQWSPQGTYLTTIHLQGVALWGGASFDRINRFAHPEVKLVDFSSYERYLVTWSPRPIEATGSPMSPFTDDDAGNNVAVWDVVTGALVRTFPMVGAAADPASDASKRIVWPMFKWSPDEKYAARVTPGQQISVYETPSLTMLGKKSIKIEGVVDFEWAPLNDQEREALEAERNGSAAPGSSHRENKLAFWMPEVMNQPARVSLMSLPSRAIIRSKNLFNVHDCKLHWQSNGDYLCVKVDRHTKTGKTKYCNLELFRLREKEVPVQVIEIKDAVVAFAWEPAGSRFALITSNDPNLGNPLPGQMPKTALSFYAYDQRKGDFLSLKTFSENKSCNNLFWSPKGRNVLAATLGSNSKFDLEWYDLDLDKPEGAAAQSEHNAADAIRCLVTREPYGTTDIEWDPSGRYVATYGSSWMGSVRPALSPSTLCLSLSLSLARSLTDSSPLSSLFAPADGARVCHLGLQGRADPGGQGRPLQAAPVAPAPADAPLARAAAQGAQELARVRARVRRAGRARAGQREQRARRAPHAPPRRVERVAPRVRRGHGAPPQGDGPRRQVELGQGRRGPGGGRGRRGVGRGGHLGASLSFSLTFLHPSRS